MRIGGRRAKLDLISVVCPAGRRDGGRWRTAPRQSPAQPPKLPCRGPAAPQGQGRRSRLLLQRSYRDTPVRALSPHRLSIALLGAWLIRRTSTALDNGTADSASFRCRSRLGLDPFGSSPKAMLLRRAAVSTYDLYPFIICGTGLSIRTGWAVAVCCCRFSPPSTCLPFMLLVWRAIGEEFRNVHHLALTPISLRQGRPASLRTAAFSAAGCSFAGGSSSVPNEVGRRSFVGNGATPPPGARPRRPLPPRECCRSRQRK